MSNAYVDLNSSSEVTAPGTLTDNAVILGAGGKALEAGPVLTGGQLLSGVSGSEPVGITAWMQQGNNCWFWNLSFTHSAGTLTLAGADGTALSASNPGYVVMPSNATQGRLVLHTITANDTLTVSDLTGNLFGTTASIAWGNSLPLYIGFMADSSDANLEPVVTRLPHISTSPSSSANIGDPSAANADLYSSVFAWNDITEADYQSMQVGLIGSLTATKDASDVYTLDALTDNDGAGRFNDSTVFTYPQGQNGSASGTWFGDGTGTEPIFSGNYDYTIARDGNVFAYADIGICTTGGTGTATAEFTLPIRRVVEANASAGSVFMFNNGNSRFEPCNYQLRGNSHNVGLFNVNINNTNLTLNDIDTDDQLYIDIQYLATKTE